MRATEGSLSGEGVRELPGLSFGYCIAQAAFSQQGSAAFLFSQEV